MVDIKGLDKAKVLKALYDHSHAQGFGLLQTVPGGVVTVDHCAGLLKNQTYFDYMHGRVLKVDLSGDEFDERLYDRDCGEGGRATGRRFRPGRAGGRRGRRQERGGFRRRGCFKGETLCD